MSTGLLILNITILASTMWITYWLKEIVIELQKIKNK